MADLHEITSYLDEYLEAKSINDYGPQGLQVEGGAEVKKIATGVSACMELFQLACEWGAGAILVHHGMFWDSEPRVVKGSLKERLKFLLENRISLIGYHLPLDRHPEVGNNIQLVKRLGLGGEEPFGLYKGKTIGYLARTGKTQSVAEFMDTVKREINRDARIHAFGPGSIGRVAICSGGGQDTLREAIARKADALLTGEESEWVYHLAREEGIHYIAAGHHATERFGVMALGDAVAKKFGVEVKFIDVFNPI
ncbi:MAG: Nif3-like dinuclear metal center hexameric protein [Nitrospinae bacterium]|nr:Nif3-like dinuclear metal center hexameric protein [Nitrospinota bacterium]